jgi:hypothetical protein
MNFEDISPGQEVLFNDGKHRFKGTVIEVIRKPMAVRIRRNESPSEIWIVQPKEITRNRTMKQIEKGKPE